MRSKLVAVSIVGLMAASLMPPAGAGQPRQIRVPTGPVGRQGPRAVSHQLLVQFHPDVEGVGRGGVHRAVGGKVVEELLLPNTYVVEVPAGLAVRDAAARYRGYDIVKNATPNFLRYKMETIPNDPHFGLLWGLRNTGQSVQGTSGTADKDIDASDAWDLETGDAATIVAVIDDGVNRGHPDLDGNMFVNTADPAGGGDQDGNGLVDDFRGWDFSSMAGASPGDNDPMGPDTHGTHVAGTIGAEGHNGVGITGVSHDVALLPIRIFKDNGGVPLGAVVNAYVYAGMMGARVANASFGGPGGSVIEIEALEFAKNTLFVAAAGNEGSNNNTTPVYPCNYGAAFAVDNVICVAATDPDDELAAFSNFGPTRVHISAPGTSVLSTSRHAPMLGAATPDGAEGFEGAIGGWTLDAPWATTTELWFIGARSLTDSPGGSYATGALDESAATPVMNLVGKTGCFLEHLTTFALESGDVVRIEGSTDGGASWPHLFRTYMGNEPGIQDEMSLGALQGSTTARVRYRLLTDGDGNVANGIHLDEVAVRCNSSTGADGGYQFLQGTSMAAPHVSGAAALAISRFPTTNPYSLRQAIMVSGDLLPLGEQGLTLSNRRLNANNLVNFPDLIPLGVPSLGGPTLSQPFQKKSPITVNTSTPGASGYWIKLDRTKYNSLSFTRSFQSSSGSKKVALAAGNTYCISANSIEPVTLNESNFSAKKCTSAPVNNTTLKHSSGWTKKKAPGHYLKTFSQTKKKGATLALGGVFFDRLALIATKCRGCGTVGLFFDKQKTPFKKVKLGATKTKKLQVVTVFNKNNGPFKAKITIKVLTGGKPVKIEGLGVLLRPFLS